MSHIGTLNEKPLHAALKEWYACAGDQFEVKVAGSVIDIVRGDLLIEIQTRNFSAMKRKLNKLTADYPVHLVYPIPVEKWIVRLAADEQTRLERRRSPKRGAVAHIFRELVYIPHLLQRPNFSLELLLIEEEETRCLRPGQGRRWWQQKWRTHERHLVRVVESQTFTPVAEITRLLPQLLEEPFTTAELAAALGQPPRLAQQMAYCLREGGLIRSVGKRGNAHLYERIGR